MKKKMGFGKAAMLGLVCAFAGMLIIRCGAAAMAQEYVPTMDECLNHGRGMAHKVCMVYHPYRSQDYRNCFDHLFNLEQEKAMCLEVIAEIETDNKNHGGY